MNDESQSHAAELTGVVVGYDGSATADIALEWASSTAASYAVPLTLLSARPDHAGDIERLTGAEAAAAGGPLADAVGRVAAAQPGLDVQAVVHPSSPVGALLAASRTAEMLVVGSRGLEGFRGLLLGSTTMQVAPHASCPVVVLYQPDEATTAARAGARHPAEVVVGYDGSESADLALGFALRHAKACGLGVAIVVVGGGSGDGHHAAPADPDDEALPTAVRSLLGRARDRAAGEPSVAVTYHVGAGRPAAILIAEAAGAPLAAVGARGRGGFAGLVLGSVGLQMLMHAECPVAVVHGTEESA